MMRPDEQANMAEVQRDQRMRQNVSKGVGAAVGTASAAFGARALPFLSEYIPTDLAMKGLQRVAPKVADFLRKGQSAGLDIKQGIDFIKSKLSPTEEHDQAQPAQDNRNLIEKYSPDLHQFILDQIRGGQTHLGAGALAELGKTGGKDFKSIIEKIKKDTKSTWAQVLDAVYGEAKAAGGTAPAAQSQQQASVQQAPQAGPGQQALMDILGKINQRLGK